MPGAHGTHTAGSAAAATNNAQGVAAISNNVKVLPVKATSDNYPPTYVTHYMEAIEYAAQRADVNIISMSFGGP
jgi:subtilisin family serine protease